MSQDDVRYLTIFWPNPVNYSSHMDLCAILEFNWSLNSIISLPLFTSINDLTRYRCEYGELVSVKLTSLSVYMRSELGPVGVWAWEISQSTQLFKVVAPVFG